VRKVTRLFIQLAATPIAAALLHGQTAITTIPIGPQPGLTAPARMILNPANHKLYVAGDQGTIGVIDTATNQSLTHIGPTNGGLYGMLPIRWQMRFICWAEISR